MGGMDRFETAEEFGILGRDLVDVYTDHGMDGVVLLVQHMERTTVDTLLMFLIQYLAKSK